MLSLEALALTMALRLRAIVQKIAPASLRIL